MWKNCLPLISLILMKIKILLPSLENWSATPHTSNISRTVYCNIYHERPGPSGFAKSQCDSMPNSFRLFFRDKLQEKVRNWTNAEGLLVYKKQVGCYKSIRI